MNALGPEHRFRGTDMTDDAYEVTLSGVRLAKDFRTNLIIDRYDPVFASMRPTKLKHLRSENSEDAITWNVFRSLRQISPTAWLRRLAEAGIPGHVLTNEEQTVVELWRRVDPPPALLLTGDEGPSEIDVIVESPHWVWFIEAKYQGDIAERTTMREGRDQVLRNIDVGSYYAGTRQFYFTLLVRSSEQAQLGAAAVAKYSNADTVRKALADHRPDNLTNFSGSTLLTWRHLFDVLTHARDNAARQDERGYAERAIDWLGSKLTPRLVD